MSRRLVLASASPARLALLRAAGFAPDVVVSGVDESTVTGTAAEVSLELATRKATTVAEQLTRTPRAAHAGPAGAGTDAGPGGPGPDGALVLGCDSVLEFDGAVHGKPADAADVRGRWARMAGRSGVLHTGHCVVDTLSGRRARAVGSTVVRFGTPTPSEVDAYVASGEPLSVAGAFTIDGRGALFVEGLDGDPGTVIGVSLPLVRRLLAELGVRATDLWTLPSRSPAATAP